MTASGERRAFAVARDRDEHRRVSARRLVHLLHLCDHCPVCVSRVPKLGVALDGLARRYARYSLNYLIAIAVGMLTAYHMVISRILDFDEVLSAMRAVYVRVYNQLKAHRSIIVVDVSRRAFRQTDDFQSKSLGCRVAIVAFRSFRFAPVDCRLARRHRRLYGAHVGGAPQQTRLSSFAPIASIGASCCCRRALYANLLLAS